MSALLVAVLFSLLVFITPAFAEIVITASGYA